jgi:hypothetical protein
VHCYRYAFFGLTRSRVVRHGVDEKLKSNTLENVYSEMLLQVCRDYPGLPDPRTLTLSEIRFFYDGIRYELQEHSKPKG